MKTCQKLPDIQLLFKLYYICKSWLNNCDILQWTWISGVNPDNFEKMVVLTNKPIKLKW